MKIEFVEAMLEREEPDEPRVTEHTTDVTFDGTAEDAVVEKLKDWFGRDSRFAEIADAAIHELAGSIVRDLQDRIDVTVDGGELKWSGDIGVALRLLGDGTTDVAGRLSQMGVIPFTELAILRLSDLRELLAEKGDR